MRWLIQARDSRGLSYIGQGDWCDPMNMVGYKGKGVSGWLSVAVAYALNTWAAVCAEEGNPELGREFQSAAAAAATHNPRRRGSIGDALRRDDAGARIYRHA
jgi:cellobiose phosphorylase